MQSQMNRAPQRQSSLWNSYFSTGRFTPTTGGTAGAPTWTIAKGSVISLFAYALNDILDGGAAGFPTGTGPATNAETNLIQRSNTNAGFLIEVYGISVYPTADSSSLMLKLLSDNVSVLLSLNGDTQQWKLGNLGFMPGAGGLYGAGRDLLQVPNLGDTSAFDPGAIVNGIPSIQNFFPFPEKLIWNPAGSADSTLVVKFTAERQIGPIAPAPRAATAGVAAYAPGNANVAVGAGYSDGVGLKVRLHSRQRSPASQNQT